MLPSGKGIWNAANNHYYVGSQTNNPISLATFQEAQDALNGSVRIYTIVLNNFTVGAGLNNATQLPIQNFKQRFIEFWDVTVISPIPYNTSELTLCFNDSSNDYIRIGFASYALRNHKYVIFNNQFMYLATLDDAKIDISIGDKILAYYSGYDAATLSIIYTCYYLVN